MGAQGQVPIITIVGAGSQVFGFNMCTDICQTPQLKGAEIRLVDVDPDRLAVVRNLFQLVSDRTKMALRISMFTDRSAAFPGTDYVIISVARQRVDRWETDLAISRRHGIVETQGECGGPGGLSLTLRNIPFILEIARDIERLAPRATILNFSNPMTRVCRAITRYTRVRTVGLCHGLLGAQKMLSDLVGRAVTVRGCGINHFNWIRGAVWEDTGEDCWAAVREAFRESDIPHWKYTRDLADVFEAVVAPGDGHIADFIHHWRGTADGLNGRYGLHPKAMAPYRVSAAEWSRRMAEYLSGKRDPMADVHGLSGEGAIPILCTVWGLLPAYRDIAVNIPNRSYIANLPDGAVVEVPGEISRDSIGGECMGDLPPAIRSLITRQLEIADLAVEAAVEGSYSKALQALAIDPIVTDLAFAKGYLNDILKAHADLLPAFG
jgi:alpha-galactosidase